MKTQNWIHGWLKFIWKKKEVPDHKKEEKIKKVFAEALETINYKECGCLPDCGCKETKDDKLKGWLP